MTVKEAIEELKKLPEDLEIIMDITANVERLPKELDKEKWIGVD